MLGERIKKARISNKLTQEALAKKLKVTKGTISNYENGHSTPSNEMLAALANVLGVTTDYLLGRSDKPTTQNNRYDPLAEINKILDEFNIKDIFFNDIEAWKSLTPEDIKELRTHFEWVVHKAKERREKK